MSIPLLPPFYDMKYTDPDGYMTSESHFYNDQIWQSQNQIIGFFNNGIPFPIKTTAQITDLEPTSQLGTVWFNSDLLKLQVKVSSGTIQTITST